jgi:hypothetical protein
VGFVHIAAGNATRRSSNSWRALESKSQQLLVIACCVSREAGLKLFKWMA